MFLGLEEDYKSEREDGGSDSSQSDDEEDRVFDEVVKSQTSSRPAETPYVVNSSEELGQVLYLSVQENLPPDGKASQLYLTST